PRARVGPALPAAGRLHHPLHPRRHADPAYRLPSTQEAPSMTDNVLIRRAPEPAAADHSHGAEWGARPAAAPLNAMGANVTIQKNWQELIRPNKLEVSVGADPKREATLVAQPPQRGFRVTLRKSRPRLP